MHLIKNTSNIRALLQLVLATCLSLGLHLGTAQAANCPPNSCCKEDTAQGAPAACAGNPINLVSGNKYQMEVDMPALPGVLGLELVRHYNSENSRVLPEGKTRNDNIGVLGRGWRLSYDRHILWQGEDTRQGDLMTLVEDDGRRLLFTRKLRDAQVFEGRDDAAGQIIRVRPATERAGLPAYAGWHFEWLSRGGVGGGLREHFDAKGWMTARMAPTGEVLTVERNTIGWPLKVTDPQGRQLVLHYMPNQARAANRLLPADQQRFAGVQHIDTPVGRFNYQYGGMQAKGTSATPMDLAANLRAVVQPGGVLRSYHHEDPRWPTLLTGISVQTVTTSAQRQEPSQRIVTWLYDNQGRAVLSVHGAPARLQRNAQGQLIKPAQQIAGTGIDQVFLSWPKPNEAVLINALGQTTRYQLATIADQLRVVESRGPGCPSCTPGNTRWRYNEAGQVLEQTRLTPKGQAIEGMRWQYDVTGRVVAEQAVRYADSQETVIDIARYEHTYRRDKDHQGREVLSSVAPQIITRPSVVAGKQQTTHMTYNDLGQPLMVTHKGWRPAIEAGQAPQPIERSVRYTYQLVNGRSVLSSVDGPLPNGAKSSPQDSDITRYTWDEQGNYLVAVETPQGKSTIAYDPAGRVASVSSMSSEQGNAKNTINTTRWTYDGQQLAALEQAPSGWPARKQTFAYDTMGRMTEVAGQTKQAYDTAGRLLWQASAMGVLETNQWDALGQLTQTKRLTNAIMQVNNYAYDEQGRITQLSDNRGRATRIAYDERGRPSLMADQSGRVMDLSAAAAPATTTTAPRPQQWRDDFGRVVATRSPDHGLRTQQFDAANRLIAMRDALGNHSQYQYDARGRIARQTVESGTESITTEWRYEGDHLVELIHPTQSEQYTYDERGLRTSKTVIRPSGKDSTLAAVTRYVYNEQGQLTGTSLPDGSWITYSRNGQGQVVALKRSPIHPQHLRWLAWLLPEQAIAQDFERDIVGVRSYTQGNGLQTRYQRSQEGVLARVVVSKPIEALSKTEQAKAADKLLQMLGMQAAYAQIASQDKPKVSTNQEADPLATLGALGIKPDPQAQIDHRYLWDTRGNLLYTRSGAKQDQVNTYAYDSANRLVVSVASEGKPEALKERAVNRYFYQGSKRVLQQQNTAAQNDIQTNTLRVNHREGTHQWIGTTQADASFSADYDKAGQPTRLGQRRFKWDAFGRLTQVSSEVNKLTASYTYNHRGERIHKAVNSNNRKITSSTTYLYDDSRQLQAELNDKQRITRQYIYLADMPVAVIDTPEGIPLDEAHSTFGETIHELGQLALAVLTTQGDITYLHTNHLGAVEAATNAQGQVIWQAAYEPFGAARVQTRGTSKALALNLRLPGQFEDAETGLYYNDHRYYDPQRGEYISPDPMGHPDGANPYAYVASNPLSSIDPLGLILFAFDGTGNSNDPEQLASLGNGISNVWQFNQVYDDGNKRYISGVGTIDTSDPSRPINPKDFIPLQVKILPFINIVEKDMALNYSGRARITRMEEYFNQEAEQFADNGTAMNVDIIGFSRGAAQAREFANIIAGRTTSNGNYQYTITGADGKAVSRCQKVNLRFMGLWDTVLSTDGILFGSNYNFKVPAQFRYVAQAVALNEYRGDTLRTLPDSTGAFPLESIFGSPTPIAGGVRIENGFIGSHGDIGGGYMGSGKQTDLAKVPLAWMIEQAKLAGVKMVDTSGNTVHASAIIHDKSDAQYARDTVAKPSDSDEQRAVNYMNGSTTKIKNITGTNMTYADTQANDLIKLNPPGQATIEYNLDGTPNVILAPKPADFSAGTVDMSKYLKWLKDNFYTLGDLHVQ